MLIPVTGTTASFTFVAGFTALNGIYKLTKITDWETSLKDGVNVYESVYVPLGINQATFDVDWLNYATGNVLTLEDANDADVVYYIPESLVATVPDPQIVKCYDLWLGIDLGVFDDPNKVAYMVDELNDTAAAVTGTSETTHMFRKTVTWMTKADYDAMDTARSVAITGLDLKTKTIQELLALVQQQATLIAAYEDLLVAHQP